MPNSAQIKPLGMLAQAMASLSSRLYTPPSARISGIRDTSWPNPLQPVQPIGPAGSQPLGFGLWQGQNLVYTPRASLQYSAMQLRGLSMYPLARACIQNVKDQVSSMPWRVQLIRMPDESAADHKKRSKSASKDIVELANFLKHPNPQENWSQLVRRLLEDLLVIDAPSMLVRRFGSGKVAELRWTDGADIVQYIDDLGYVPMGIGPDGKPDVAYAQNWQGIPRVDLSWQQIVYRPFNLIPRGDDVTCSVLYGCSPTEQAADEIKIGANRLNFVADWYTEGTMSDMIQVVPGGANNTQIKEAEEFQNSEMGGNLARRRKLRLLQGFTPDGKDQILFPKAGSLTDPYDDLHIRKICFHYGVSPQRLIHAQNRATAEAGQEAAEEEGALPWIKWVEDTFNFTIQTQMGAAEYEITLNSTRQADELKEAQTAHIYVSDGVKTREEIRDDMGLDPSKQPEASLLTVTTATGVIPLDLSVQTAEANLKTAQNPPKPVIAAPGAGGGQPKPKPAAKGLQIETHESMMASIERSRYQKALEEFFGKSANAAAAAVETAAKKLAKSDKADQDQIAQAAYDAIEWEAIIDASEKAMFSAGIAGHSIGISQIPSVKIQANIVEAQQLAQAYAHDRAAEMVGMRYGADGTLRANPKAEWAITDTTRDILRADVERAFASETKIADLVESIRDSAAFTDSRAEMVARTEVSMAQSGGVHDAWKATGMVATTKWILSADHTEEDRDVCDKNAAAGEVEFGKPFPSGATRVPAHPRCNCVNVVGSIKK